VLQLDLLQAAMPSLEILKLCGLGGFYGTSNSLTSVVYFQSISLKLKCQLCFLPTMTLAFSLSVADLICYMCSDRWSGEGGLLSPVASCDSSTVITVCNAFGVTAWAEDMLLADLVIDYKTALHCQR